MRLPASPQARRIPTLILRQPLCYAELMSQRIARSVAKTGSAPQITRTSATVLETAGATPMMAQYIEIKAANTDCLLFYRMGDFYELFFEDAEIASRALGIVLTKRGKHGGADIPMCGVPVDRADDYLSRLIALGHRVAVCAQTEDPPKRKSVVQNPSFDVRWSGWLRRHDYRGSPPRPDPCQHPAGDRPSQGRGCGLRLRTCLCRHLDGTLLSERGTVTRAWLCNRPV